MHADAEPREILVLFDIDGTLLDGGGAGRRAMERAVEAWSGRPLGSFRVPMGGRTDLEIFRELLERLGVDYPRPPARRAILRRYLALLDEELVRTPPRVYPGVHDLLDAMAADPRRWRAGLVTGNVAGGAERKLRAAGLAGRFACGAYGSDREDRNHLVPVALARYRRLTGRALSARRAVVIGDTDNDLRCARAAGSPALLVGTGLGDVARLAREADAFFPDLGDTRRVLETLERLVDGGA